MSLCTVAGCPGHPSILEALLHGQHDTHQRLTRIAANQEKIMTDIDAVTAAFTQLKADVTRALGDLQADVAQIAQLLAAQGGVPADVQVKLDALGQGLTDLDAAVNTADPAPAPPAA